MVLGAFLLAPGWLAAHPLLEDSCWVVVTRDKLMVRVTATLREIIVAQALQPDEKHGLDLTALRAACEPHGEYVRSHLHLQADGRELKGRVLQFKLPVIQGVGTNDDLMVAADLFSVTYDLEFPLESAAATPQIIFRHEMLKEFNYAHGTAWDVTYALQIKRTDEKQTDRAKIKTGMIFNWPLSATNQTAAAP